MTEKKPEERKTNRGRSARHEEIAKLWIDGFTNGAAKRIARAEKLLWIVAVAVVLAIPTTLWTAAQWTQKVEDAIASESERTSTRDSTMVDALDRAIEDLKDHKLNDLQRDQIMSQAVQALDVTMSAVVANQKDLQDEVRRLRDRFDQ